MPYATRKVKNKNCYKNYNKKTKQVYSKCTSKKNAMRQLRLLRAIEYNKEFVPRKQTRRNTKKV